MAISLGQFTNIIQFRVNSEYEEAACNLKRFTISTKKNTKLKIKKIKHKQQKKRTSSVTTNKFFFHGEPHDFCS